MCKQELVIVKFSRFMKMIGMKLTVFYSYLPQAWHPNHKKFSVTNESFIILKCPPIVPSCVEQGGTKLASRPVPKG